jgi:uncharacterized protein YhhL (DUF1145 family)
MPGDSGRLVCVHTGVCLWTVFGAALGGPVRLLICVNLVDCFGAAFDCPVRLLVSICCVLLLSKLHYGAMLVSTGLYARSPPGRERERLNIRYFGVIVRLPHGG